MFVRGDKVRVKAYTNSPIYEVIDYYHVNDYNGGNVLFWLRRIDKLQYTYYFERDLELVEED